MDQSSANPYQQAYYKLLAQLPEPVQAKVLQAKDKDGPVDADVYLFIKNVISMAEQND